MIVLGEPQIFNPTTAIIFNMRSHNELQCDSTRSAILGGQCSLILFLRMRASMTVFTEAVKRVKTVIDFQLLQATRQSQPGGDAGFVRCNSDGQLPLPNGIRIQE